MARNFSRTIYYDKKTTLAVVVPHTRKDGIYYEVNINGYPRFFMNWSPLGRYDVVEEDGLNLPQNLVLAVSDILEAERKKA
jgi:hypothetical protein